MKPLSIGMTDNQAISGALLEEEANKMLVKSPKKRKVGAKALAAAKKAAPKDVFCLAWLASESVDEVFIKLKALGFSGSVIGIKARAIRIRKAKRHPLDLPKLAGEGAAHKNWDRVQAALLARTSNDDRHVAQLELTEIMKNS